MPCRKKEEGGKRMNAFDIASDILHPPLSMKDLERGTWSAKRTGAHVKNKFLRSSWPFVCNYGNIFTELFLP